MKISFLPLAVFFLITSSIFAQVWQAQAEGIMPSNYTVMNLSIVNEDVVWAVAIDFNQWQSPVPSTHELKVMRTMNGGDSWVVTDFTDAPGRMSYGIYALDENTAMLSTSNFQNEKGIYRTTNAGMSWTEVLSGVGEARVLFFNDLDGVCIAPGSAIARSNDGGESWTLLTEGTDYPSFLSNEGHLNSPTNWDIIGNTLWVGTTRGRVYKTTDKGETWTVHQAANTNEGFNSITFINSLDGLALVGDFNNPPLELLRTDDGGVSWIPISNSSNLSEFLAIPSTNSIIGASFFDDLTVWSSDLGTSWDTLDDEINVWGPAFSSPETGWIVDGRIAGPHPRIYKWTGPALTSVTETAIGAIELSPNPATDFIYFTFPVAPEKPIDIQLYTISGQLLLTTNISDGEAIPVDHLPPGLYHVKLLLDDKSYRSTFVKQ